MRIAAALNCDIGKNLALCYRDQHCDAIVIQQKQNEASR